MWLLLKTKIVVHMKNNNKITIATTLCMFSLQSQPVYPKTGSTESYVIANHEW